MRITRRLITLFFLGFLLLASLAVLALLFTFRIDTVPTNIALIVIAALIILFVAAWYSWSYTEVVVTCFVTIIAAIVVDDPRVAQQISPVIFLPPIIAMVLTTPRWVLATALGVMLIILWRAGWQGVYTEIDRLLIFGVGVGGLLLSRMITNNALNESEQARHESQQASIALQSLNTSLEQRVAERTVQVETALLDLQGRADEQARLLQEIEQQRLIIRDLSVPVIPINRSTLVMPLVGEIDTARLSYIHDQALQALQQRRARTLILDVTGVPIVDTQIGQGILTIAQSARLLGGHIVLVGVRPEVAQTIVSLGINIGQITTYGDLQSALRSMNPEHA